VTIRANLGRGKNEKRRVKRDEEEESDGSMHAHHPSDIHSRSLETSPEKSYDTAELDASDNRGTERK